MTMNIVPKGTRVSRSEVIRGDVVEKPVVTLNEPQDVHYSDTWTLDFADVSRLALLTLATRTIVIEIQSKFRKAKGTEAIAKFDSLKVSVAEYLESKRARTTPEQVTAKALKVAAKLTKAQLLALAAEMEDEDEDEDEYELAIPEEVND